MQSRKPICMVAAVCLSAMGCTLISAPLQPTAAPTSIPPQPTLAALSFPTVEESAATMPADTPTPEPPSVVPNFARIVMVVLENKEYGTVIGNANMPYFNSLAKSYTLLTQHYAVAHPSLPNYLSLIAGDTFGVDFDCTKCIYDAVTLPDLIEASGRTWKAYMEDMPSPCFTGADSGNYAMKHNPFMYFDAIRLDAARCQRSVVPILALYSDLTGGTLPDYAFISPNLCNDAHDCGLGTADDWLRSLMGIMLPVLDREQKPYLVIVTWDEGQGEHSCCGLPKEAGGRVATVLVSPQVRNGFEDATPYTHYSLLKTIAEAWHLRYLGHAADPDNVLIVAPWK